MISYVQEKIKAELKLVLEDVSELFINTAKVLDRIPVCMDRIENTMPSAVVMAKVSSVLNGCQRLNGKAPRPIKKEVSWFSRIAEHLVLFEQTNDTDFTPAPVHKGHFKAAKRSVH